MVAAAIVLPANPFRSSRLVRVIPSPCSIGTRFGQHLSLTHSRYQLIKVNVTSPSKALTPGVIMEAAMLKKAILLCAMILLAGSSPSYAQRQTQTGDVYVRVVRVGFILGAGGGEGNLTYGGRVYPFSVSGISIGTIGASSADLTGRAYNLRRPSDIAGTYTAAGGGVVLVGGVRFVRLQNSNGVIVQLRGAQVGIEGSLNLSGMTVAMR